MKADSAMVSAITMLWLLLSQLGLCQYSAPSVGFATAPAIRPVGYYSDSSVLNYPYGLAVRNGYAYVVNFSGAAGSIDIAVFDVSNPASPALVSTFKDGTNLNGNAVMPVVSDKYLVVSNYTDRLAVIDISNPHSLTTVATVTDGTNLNTVNWMKWQGSFIYASMCNGGAAPTLTIVDMTNPLVPVVRGHLTDARLTCSFYSDVYGRYAYLPQDRNNPSAAPPGTTTFAVVDVSDPDNPTVTGVLNDTHLAFAQVQVVGSVAYVLSSGGLAAINVSNPAAPALISTLGSPLAGGNPMAVQWPYAYYPVGVNGNTHSIYGVNIADPSNMRVEFSLTDTTNISSVGAAETYGQYLFAINNGGPNSLVSLLTSGMSATPTLQAGNVRTGRADIDEDLHVGSNIEARSVNAGAQGVQSIGPISGSSMKLGNGTSGKALCFKADKSIGRCTTAVDSSGGCTCN